MTDTSDGPGALEPWSLTQRALQAAAQRDLGEAGRTVELKVQLEAWYAQTTDYLVYELGQRLGLPVELHQARRSVEVSGNTPLKRVGAQLSGAQSHDTVVLAVTAQDLRLVVRGSYVPASSWSPEPKTDFELAVPGSCEVCGRVWCAGRRVSHSEWADVFEPVTETDVHRHSAHWDSAWWKLPSSQDELLLGLGERLRAPHYVPRRDYDGSWWEPCTGQRALSTASPGASTTPDLSESPVEELFWAACQRAPDRELAGLVQQHVVGPYRLDLALPRLLVGVELDGYAWHTDRRQFTRDRARQRALELAGWRLVRFSGAEVHADPDDCVRQLVAFVRLVTAAT